MLTTRKIVLLILLAIAITACGVTPTPSTDAANYTLCTKVVGLTNGVIVRLPNEGTIASTKYVSDYVLEIGDVVKVRWQGDLLLILTDESCG